MPHPAIRPFATNKRQKGHLGSPRPRIGFSVRDSGHEGMTLEQFHGLPEAIQADLGRAAPPVTGPVLALGDAWLPRRLYRDGNASNEYRASRVYRCIGPTVWQISCFVMFCLARKGLPRGFSFVEVPWVLMLGGGAARAQPSRDHWASLSPAIKREKATIWYNPTPNGNGETV